MKTTLLLAVTALAVSCGQSNADFSRMETGSNLNSKEEQSYSCSLFKPEASNYSLKLDVNETTLTVKQSATNARFATLKYSITEDQSVTIPTEEPKYACSAFKPEGDSYSLRINVYEDRLIILQSSRSARFAPLKYKIAPVQQ